MLLREERGDETVSESASKPEKPIEVDLIITCKGCGRVRTVVPDKALVGAKALIAWTKEFLPRHACLCGHGTCDLKCRLKGEPETSGPGKA